MILCLKRQSFSIEIQLKKQVEHRRILVSFLTYQTLQTYLFTEIDAKNATNLKLLQHVIDFS